MLAACSVAASACGGGSSKGKAPARGAAKLRQRAAVPARPGPLRASVAGLLPRPRPLPPPPLSSSAASRPGAAARGVGRLPLPLRYPAVAAVDGRILIAGGTSGVTPQRTILTFDPGTSRVTRLGELSHSLTHAAGASLNG